MSSAVAHRLAELAQRGEARRRRTSEIKQESSLILDTVRWRQRVQASCRRSWTQQIDEPTQDPHSSETEGSVLDQVRALLGGDVLDQARTLLSAIDACERELWNEDDTLIVRCFQEAWAAARRKGYTVEDLQAVLRSLRPRE